MTTSAMEERESAEADLLVCGSCKRSFQLGNITGFMKHKKFDCEDPGNATDPKSKMLVCLTCRQKFTTPWSLLKHAQNVHFLQIYLEHSYCLGVQAVSIADDHQANHSYAHIPDFDQNLSALPGQTMQQWIQGIEQEMERVEPSSNSNGGNHQGNSSGKGPQPVHAVAGKLEGAVVLQSTRCESAPVTIGKNFGGDMVMTKGSHGKLVAAIPSKNNVLSPNSRACSVANQPVSHGKGIEVLIPVSNENSLEMPMTSKPQMSHGKRIKALISAETMQEQSTSKSTTSHGERLEALVSVSSDDMSEPTPSTSKSKISHGKRIEALIPAPDPFRQDSPVSKPQVSHGKGIESSNITCTSAEVQPETFMSLPPLSLGDHMKSLLPMSTDDDSADLKLSAEIATQTNTDSDGLIALEQQISTPSRDVTMKEAENCCDNPDCCVRKAKLGKFCENQNCGITVMPGTHESLKKCCNAVVPKLRKRHIEIKHKSGHKFISRGRRREKLRKKTSPADIYIDLAPTSKGNGSSGSKSDDDDEDDAEMIPSSNNNDDDLAIMPSSSTSSHGNNKSITNISYSKQKSVIIQPGSTFSIPIPYASEGNPPTISKTFTNTSSTVLISSQQRSNPENLRNPTFEQQQMSNQTSVGLQLPPSIGLSANATKPCAMGMEAIFETLGLSTSTKVEQTDTNFLIQSLKEATQHVQGHSQSKNTTTAKENSYLSEDNHDLDLVGGSSQDLDVATLDPSGNPQTGQQGVEMSMALTGDSDEGAPSGKKRRYPTSRPYKCPQCDQAFNQRIHLKKHLSKHTGIKPFKCDQCDYSTVERSHLKVHIRVHTGEKPFKCTYCEYATAQNSTLKIHLKRHHASSSGNYHCSECGKSFSKKSQFDLHMASHDLALPPCDISDNHALVLLPPAAQVRENTVTTS